VKPLCLMNPKKNVLCFAMVLLSQRWFDKLTCRAPNKVKTRHVLTCFKEAKHQKEQWVLTKAAVHAQLVGLHRCNEKVGVCTLNVRAEYNSPQRNFS